MTSANTQTSQHARKIIRLLKKDYPEVACALNYETPVQLLVATILSAQCTDKQVNIVTKDLFAKYPAAEDFAAATQKELEKAIQTTGFFRNKAKNIRKCCQSLMELHNGEVPRDMKSMTDLAGVGRKTANVVLGSAYGLPTGVVVDTHVTRLSRRLGLTTNKDPIKIERDLIEVVPKKEWIDFSHRLIFHGRQVCKARRPLCEACSLKKLCPKIDVPPAKDAKEPSAAQRKEKAVKKKKAAKRKKPRSDA